MVLLKLHIVHFIVDVLLLHKIVRSVMNILNHITSLLYKLLEPRIEAAITDRLVAYHEGLIERGQISDSDPRSRVVYSSEAYNEQSKPSLRLVAHVRN